MSIVGFPTGTLERVRVAGALAAAAAAGLYLLIGIGLLSIGTAASGEAPDLLSFGLTMAATFVVVAALMVRFRSRRLWIAIALVQLLVIGGYFAMASIRVPPVETWGLLVKLCQAVVLVAATALALRRPVVTGR
jgi:hypothetical protein